MTPNTEHGLLASSQALAPSTNPRTIATPGHTALWLLVALEVFYVAKAAALTKSYICTLVQRAI